MSIVEKFKTVSDLVVKVHDAGIKAELQAALINAQGGALELQERVARLQDENAVLREQLRQRASRPANAKSINGIWWGDTNEERLPFCPRCASKDNWVPLETDFRWADGAVRDDGQFSYACGACSFQSFRNIEEERKKGAVLDVPAAGPPKPTPVRRPSRREQLRRM